MRILLKINYKQNLFQEVSDYVTAAVNLQIVSLFLIRCFWIFPAWRENFPLEPKPSLVFFTCEMTVVPHSP